MENLTSIMEWRHSAKAYDPNKKISKADIQSLKAVLRLSPSATNIQPWHFLIADNEAGKARIAKATQPHHAANMPRIQNASNVVVFCSRIIADDEYLSALLEQEDIDGRFLDANAKKIEGEKRKKAIDYHRFVEKDEQAWLTQQVYISMGTLLLGAAMLGIDATAIEGIDTQMLNEEFDLNSKGYTAIGAVSLGYRGAEYYNIDLPKSRLSEETVFTEL